MILDKYANLKYRYGIRNFWEEEYFVDTVVWNKKVIKEYMKNQLDKYHEKSTWPRLWIVEENNEKQTANCFLL